MGIGGQDTRTPASAGWGWKAWDLFVLPGTEQAITHHAHETSTEEGGAALFWWHDEPLLKYLGAGPITPTFQPKFFSKEVISLHLHPARRHAGQVNQDALRCGLLAFWRPSY